VSTGDAAQVSGSADYDWKVTRAKAVREISREPQTHEFLIKALREASGELADELDSLRSREARRHPDGEWSFLQIATHVRESERVCLDYVERIVSRRTPVLEAVDLGALADEIDVRAEDVDAAVYEYLRLRHRLVYQLWDLSPHQWERTGIHRYRGAISVLQLARDLHLHDLEHLWQVRANRLQLSGSAH
jgi:hypothetical protein